MQLQDKLKNDLLLQVQKPGQYLGLEWGAYRKDWNSAKCRMAIVYPDLYELGMSNFGIKILYNIVNRHPDYLCDRAFAVMPDMEALMKERNVPLWSWEQNRPIKEFDFVGFSLAYELCYTNVLNVMDLAGITLEAKDRQENEPLIFAGGPAVFNPEPMADFMDFYIIGDGEELITEVQDIKVQMPNASREELLFALSQLPGIYVPRFYQADEINNYLPQAIKADVPYPVNKRITKELGDFNQPVSGPVPHIEVVQDKQVLEIRRGCDRGCRFCQVGYTYLPVRERSPEDLLRLSIESRKNSGYEDMSLLSLSASDYTCLTEAARAINDEHASSGIGLSMPSQRADRFDVGLADELSQARKSGMTFAPEAGSERMRRIINKGLSQEDIYKTIKGTYEAGWSHIKLYFMIGLPFETDEDLDAILDILTWSVNMSKELRKLNPQKYNKLINLTCTISTFVPKTFTAFQWFSQCSQEDFAAKQKYLMDGIYERRLKAFVKLNCTDPGIALIESVLSRGDRRWSRVIKDLWQNGSRLESWAENFSISRWQNSASKFDLDLNHEASGFREPGSKQPWDVLSIGFTDKFLLHEWNQAVQELETIPCTENKCHACGVCFNLDVVNVVTVDRSDKNPFVTVIDIEKRKTSYAGLNLSSAQNSEAVILSPEGASESTYQEANASNDKASDDGSVHVVVKHTQSAQKLQIKITKLGDLKYISHLDFQKMIERALRRTGLPVVHSTGFNQRMKISWLSALPLFVESEGEYLEIDLAESFDDLEKLTEILNLQLPEQARIVEVVNVGPQNKLSKLEILETVYIASKDIEDKDLQSLVEGFLKQETITIERFSKGKTKSVDLRPEIVTIKVLNNSQLELTLRKSQRADQVLQALLPGTFWNLRKTKQIYT
ncbi:MAG: TIGR03960 family B12-binding radical SAM protein [Candidatus Caenarcaniphilales bacterium]|jgi:radical SAM family uncharacterized protein/radical SAM-linked protein|nr:TIGR03960 family B12-binding radical SAM protein [Candidatus Caenarcaniphilales bacterium]